MKPGCGTRDSGLGKAEAKKSRGWVDRSETHQSPSPVASPHPATITIDDFAKLDLRVATVVACELVDGSDKLLRFELDAGELGTRQIFSGIRAAYNAPEKLIGRKVVFIANQIGRAHV